MDIRKPNAAHSIREFAIEIGTIIVGILLALGFEAAVEALHHHDLVRHAKSDLRLELVDNQHQLEAALASEGKAATVLQGLDGYARARLSGKTAPFPHLTVAIKTSTMASSAWESTIATQALSYMSFDEAHALAKAYSAAKNYNDLQADARKSLFELSAVDVGSIDRMSPQELSQVRHVIDLNESYLTTSLITGRKLAQTYADTLRTVAAG